MCTAVMNLVIVLVIDCSGAESVNNYASASCVLNECTPQRNKNTTDKKIISGYT